MSISILLLLLQLCHCRYENGESTAIPDEYAPYFDFWDVVESTIPIDDELCDLSDSLATLDVDSPNESLIYENRKFVSGVLVTTLVPNGNQVITMVVNSGKIIWIADCGEKCTFVEVFSNIRGKLAIVRVEDGIMLGYNRFEEVNGKWRYSPLDEFYKKLDDMMDHEMDEERRYTRKYWW